ncbi:glycosyltransferase [Micromonospora sp. LOL_023]|uniref:glycosyltransferase n=1 Tax=Micromonospora sp. LOL_023 TaxID=3345418 RepID=UPI003A8C4146
MTQVIVAATPFHGHFGPLYTIAADLAARGHEVLFLTGSRFADRVTSAGMHFVALDPSADFDDRAMTAEFPAFADVTPGPPLHEFFWTQVFADAIEPQYRQLLQILAEFPATVILHDTVFLGALAFPLRPQDADRPTTIALGVLPPMLLSDDAPPFTTGEQPLSDTTGRTARSRALNAEIRSVYAQTQQYLEKSFATVGATLPEFIFDSVITRPDHYLQLTSPSFEYPRSDAPESFRCIGALPQPSTTTYRTPAWWPELKSGRPVVVVTQGTLANDDLSELIEPTMHGLADLDVLLVVATARSDGPDDLRRLVPQPPANARIEGYVPFDRLLPYADVLVTNGGYGGVHTALHNGVPLVVAGDTEDKPDVAARVAWSGVGVDLRTGRPAPEAVQAAVRTVLADHRFRRAALAIRDEFRQFDPLSAIAAVVDGSPSAGKQQ